MKYFILVFLCIAFSTKPCFSQNSDNIPDLDQMVGKENYTGVYTISKERISNFFMSGDADTIQHYLSYLGNAASKLKGDAVAKTELFGVLKKAKEVFPYHPSLVDDYLEVAFFFSMLGNNELAYQLATEIDKYFSTKQNLIPDKLSVIQANLGNFSMRMGKYAISSTHYLKSVEYLKSNSKADKQKWYFANNSLGIVMFYSSKLDSAVYFFTKAIDVLNTMDSTPVNRYFRVALVQNNIAGCYTILGKAKQAIAMSENVIANNKKFIDSPEPNAKKEQARIGQFQAIDNLAKVYIELGDLSRAHDLLYYSYQQKLANFGNKSPETFKSLSFLGTIYNNQRNFSKAKLFLEDALKRMKDNGDVDNSWIAEVYSQLAIANKALNNKTEAAFDYQEANRIYEKVYGGQYDDLYLSYLYQMSQFYAEDKNPALAINIINKGLDYVRKVQGENSLQVAQQLKNLAVINIQLKNYKAAADAAERGIKIISSIAADRTELLDSIKIETEKPWLIFLKSKADYELLTVRDTLSILCILNNLYEAKSTLDRRKTIFANEKDINTLIADNKDLLDFIKQLNLELYHLTGNNIYVDKIIGLQESGTYARIRARMDKQKAIRFSRVPPSVIEQEAFLKDAIKNSLQSRSKDGQQISRYLAAWNQWNAYKQMLKDKYPDYYNMRYANKELSLHELSQSIPNGMSVVRYFFTADSLYALVASKEKQELFSIHDEGLSDNIITLNDSRTSPKQITEISFRLYQQLWQPLEKTITTSRIIIIPDGLLYNVSFEMLTPVPVNDYAGLAKNCLLNKYAISYHYSLLALNPQKKEEQMKGNFIAFTPGFTDRQKEEYSAKAKNDSLHLDNSYLKLLPLPFTAILAEKIKETLGGKLFSNNQSTPAAFKEQAGNHSVIYIGTHAESNNSFPEFSRLIFAKDLIKTTTDNSIYLFDIYNCNLASHLAVLTACETGSPGYQDGEGMISMAHAFNYAGSESILTGLWKIDEQTSIIITDHFYKFLQDGLSKDEALRKAKLEYLRTHQGRQLAPQYWAGLVIMGDTSPLVFEPASTKWWYLFITVAILALAFSIIYYRKRNKRSVSIL
ncbi:MAG: CHAT domain-containing protein [Ginsengibacter sp.]